MKSNNIKLLASLNNNLGNYYLLDDLLFWSKVQMKSNSIKWTPINLHNTVKKCIATFSSSINAKQLNIRNNIPVDFTILADQMRCEFITRNILHNAIKYSELCRDIEIGVLEKEGKWDFYVKDKGVGISYDHLQKLFDYEHTRRSLKDTMNEQGAGIGLLLCHDFIEELGWHLEVESEIGKGTTFHILIVQNADEIKKQKTTIKKASFGNALELTKT